MSSLWKWDQIPTAGNFGGVGSENFCFDCVFRALATGLDHVSQKDIAKVSLAETDRSGVFRLDVLNFGDKFTDILEFSVY
jgi:hypothetical protein